MHIRQPSASRSGALLFGLAFALVALAPQASAQAPSAAVAAAQPARMATLDRVRAQGKLVLGYHADARPMSYRDASGKPAGHAVTLCHQVVNAVKAEVGLPQLAVEWVALAPSSGLQSVRQGKVDLLCSAELASLANRATVSFSLPVFPGGIAALVRTDASKLLQHTLEERPLPYRPVWRASPLSPIQHRTLSVVAGTPAVDWAKDRASKLGIIAKLDTVDSYEAGVAKVARRDADVLFGDRAVLLDLAARSPDAKKLRVLTRHFTYEPLALALARNDDDFRLVVDRALMGFYASPGFGDAYAAVFGAPDADTVEYFRQMPR